MSDAPRYRITTVRDFFTVPEDRLGACLADFAKYLRAAPHWVALLTSVSDQVNGAGAISFEVGEVFEWIDDDAESISLGVLLPDGERSTVLTLTPSDADAISRNLEHLAEASAAARPPRGDADA